MEETLPKEEGLPQLGWVSFKGHLDQWVHKPWYLSWPPPAHLAISRIRTDRGETYGVVDALAWISDKAFFPLGDVVLIHDQVSVSAEGAPVPDWTPPEHEPLLPAAVYTRRHGVIHTDGGTD